MTYVLSCLHSGISFDCDVFATAQVEGHADAVENALKVLTQKGKEAAVCAAMHNYVGEELPEYSHDKYFEDGQKWESLERFFAAAEAHKEMVLTAFGSIAQ